MRMVKLLAPHTIAGELRQTGEVVEMTDAEAQWYVSAIVGLRVAVNEEKKRDPKNREWWEARKRSTEKGDAVDE